MPSGQFPAGLLWAQPKQAVMPVASWSKCWHPEVLLEPALENANSNLCAALLNHSESHSDGFQPVPGFIGLDYSGVMITNTLETSMNLSAYSVYAEAWFQMRLCPIKLQLPS